MNSKLGQHDREHLDSVFLYSLQALPASEIQAVEAHLSSCADCRQQIETLRHTIDFFASWPTDLLRPTVSLWGRLAQRVGEDTVEQMISPPPQLPAQPEWEEAAPGIDYKLLAVDTEKNRVSMLVRLAPGTDYPPHRHAGVEELHLLHGELMINDKKLYPGDYIRGEAGSVDRRVWSETGCTCVLFTSIKDVLF
jgi:ChrR-like protein with cupin domain/putative zinc finger protein